jgi:hypothetical protein
MSDKTTSSPHRWTFHRTGGIDQALIATGADVAAIPDLDQKLWVALSCPVDGLEFDRRTLELLDTDNDGRVRAPEIKAAIRWCTPLLRDAGELTRGGSGLPLAAINDGTSDGARLLASAKRINAALGKPTATVITVQDTSQTAKFFEQAKLNGDGVVPPETVDDAEAKRLAADIIACLGGDPDRSGKSGVTKAKIDAFYTEAAAYLAWVEVGVGPDVQLLGDRTAAAADAVDAVRAKIDDYFARCRLAAYDARAQAALNGEETAYLAVAAKDLKITAEEVLGFPLSRIEANRPLPLLEGLNPAWATAIGALVAKAIGPILGEGRKALPESEWHDLKRRLEPFGAWRSGKKGGAVERLGADRVRALLKSPARATLMGVIAQDEAVAPEIAAMANVERLARYHRDLFKLLNNFVSFTDFYARRRAIFQVGTLYLDGRSCELVVRVNDAAKHAAMAGMSGAYLVYCDCTRKSTGEKMSVAAAMTAGDSDHLFVGRNALFYDLKGQDWDATITKVIENPISVRQAFFLPYKRTLRWIEEMAAKRAAAADEASTASLQSAATTAGEAATTGQAPAKKPAFDIGVVAALGVAVGGITAALGALLEAFFGLGLWMPVGLLAMILLISGPSMLIAWMKLRRRDLAPILDANGWAVNGRVRLNLGLGRAMTAEAVLPKGARRNLSDPYAEKRSRWPEFLLLLLILGVVGVGLYRSGHLAQWFPSQQWLVRPAASETPAETEKK